MTRQPPFFAYPLSKTLVWLIAVFAAAPVWAQTNRVVQVEEHWQLHLGQPDAARSAPQVTMVMSPNGTLDGEFFLFTLNHQNVPAHHPGGMQVQLWDGEDLIDHSASEQQDTLRYDNEVVSWVQRLTLDGGTLTFQVRDGSSETWGAFGGDDLTVSMATEQSGLNTYRPGVSLTESEVGYAQNRVTSLTLTKLVWITEDGEVHEQNAPIPIDTSLDP